jgi:hypothetical protein
MCVKLFFGARLNGNLLVSQKVDSFRKRFDQAYFQNTIFQLPLIPSFDLPPDRYKNFLLDLEDLIDGHFCGVGAIEIEFLSLEFLEGKKHRLFLRPNLDDDFFHFRESVFDLVKSNGGLSFKKTFEAQKIPFVPIGTFQDPLELNLAIEDAKSEFIFPFTSILESFILFEKRERIWKNKVEILSPENQNLHRKKVAQDYYSF